MDIKLRKPNIDEFEGLVPNGLLMLQASGNYTAYNLDLEKAKQAVSGWLKRENQFFIRLAEDEEGDLLGFIVGHVYERWFTRDLSASDQMIFVMPDARGKGVAKDMLKAFVAWANEQGAVKKFLGDTLGIDPEASHALYTGAGFRPTGNLYEE